MTLQELIRTVLSRSGPVAPLRVPGTETTVTQRITDRRPDFPPIEELRAILLGTKDTPPTGVVQRDWAQTPTSSATMDVEPILRRLMSEYPFAARMPSRIVGNPSLADTEGAYGAVRVRTPSVIELDPTGPDPYRTLLHELVHVGDTQNLGRGRMLLNEAGASEEKAYGLGLGSTNYLRQYNQLLNTWPELEGRFDSGSAYDTAAELIKRLQAQRSQPQGRP